MKTRLISLLPVFVLAVLATAGQTLEGVHLRLVRPGQEYGGVLLGPNKAFPGSTQNDTFYLPPGGGTLLTSAAAGWQVGGQGLAPITNGLLGSTDGADVSLIAGGLSNIRLRLSSSTATVTMPDLTELRLGDQAGGQYTGFRSASTNKTSGYTLVWPDSLPGGPDVRLQVDSIVGSMVYLRFSNPNTTGSIGFKQAGTPTVTDGNTNNDWKNVTGLNFYLGPNAIYSFESLLAVTGGNTDGILVRIGEPIALPATKGAYVAVPGVTVQYYVMNLHDNNPVTTGGEVHNVSSPELETGGTYILKGYIETDATVPANTVLQILVRANQAANVTVTPKSSVQLITE